MRLLVLSDTHASAGKVDQVMNRLRRYLSGIDAILHAGDIISIEMLQALQRIAPVHAVAGNMDGDDLRGQLGEQRVLALAGRRIGLVHGWGSPVDLPDRVLGRFHGEDGKPSVDIVVFGHSHRPMVERRGEVWLLNPGSPTDRLFAPYRALILLDLAADVKAEIVKLD